MKLKYLLGLLLIFILPMAFSVSYFSATPSLSSSTITTLNTNNSILSLLPFVVETAGTNLSIVSVNFTVPSNMYIGNITTNVTGWVCTNQTGSLDVYNCTNTTTNAIQNLTTNFTFNIWATADGNYTMLVSSTDNASTVYNDRNMTIVVDDIPPAVTLFNLSNASRIYGTTHNVTIMALDNVGLSGVNVTANSIVLELTFSEGNKTDGNWTGLLDLSSIGEGNQTFTVSATNDLGNGNATYSFYAFVDRTAPLITLNTVDGTYSNNSLLSINFNVTDNLASYVNCTSQVWNSSGSVHINSTNLANYSQSIYNVAVTNDGEYYWNVSCYDNATNTANITPGNLGISSTYTLNSDTFSPFNSTGFIESLSSNSIMLTSTYNELVKCTIVYSTNSVVNGSGTEVNSTGFTNTGQVDITGLAESTQYFYNITQCWDQAGNVNSTVYGTFNFTTQATPSTGSSGGGGGSSGSASTSYSVGDVTNSRTTWNVGGSDTVRFEYGGTFHEVTLERTGRNYIVLDFDALERQTMVYNGEYAIVDLNGDGVSDLRVIVESLESGRASLRVEDMGLDRRTSIEVLNPTRESIEEPEEVVEETVDSIVETATPSSTVESVEEPTSAPVNSEMSSERDEGINVLGLVITLAIIGLLGVALFYGTKSMRNK